MYNKKVRIVVKAYNTREISFPLEGVKIPTEFKFFYIDTGLMISQLGDEVPQEILKGNISSYKGAIAENMVASAFATNGIALYYFYAPSGSHELDFLFEKSGEGFITLPLYAIGLIELNNEQRIVETADLSKLKVPIDNS